MRVSFLFIFILLTIFQGTEMVNTFILQWRKILVVDELRRLQQATMRAFHEKSPPSEAEFWKEIGRAEPLKDPWGENYRLSRMGDDLVWYSAGPDRIYPTRDDFSRYVIVRDGLVLYLENKASEPTTGTRVMDAK